jgi:hypothetical protein
MDSPSGGRFLVGLRRTAFVPFHRSACLVFRTDRDSAGDVLVLRSGHSIQVKYVVRAGLDS